MFSVSAATAVIIGAGVLTGPILGTSHSSGMPQKGTETVASMVHCSSHDGRLAKKLTGDIANALANRSSVSSLSFYDRPTKTKCTFKPSRKYDSASVVKTIILGALLYEKGGILSESEATLAHKMITESDNSSATTLWKQLSDLKDPKRPNPVKIKEFLNKAGMRDTVPSDDGYWGLTQVTAGDQSKLLRIFSGVDSSVLDGKARSYALRLMSQVQANQRWGATAGAPLDSLIHVKNGWLQRGQGADVEPFDRGDWKVNSMAAITGGGHNSGLVVLTENNRVPEGRPAGEGWNHGIDSIETISRAIYRDVYPGAKGYHPSRPFAPTDLSSTAR